MADPGSFLNPADWPMWMQSGMTPTPQPGGFPPIPGSFDVPTPRVVGIGETLKNMFLPDRDESGMPKPMGAGDVVNAALWVLPGFGGLRGVKSAPASSASRIADPVKAYHGSPYDFERFDASKIGSGEGAQAFGHGLYFAENPEVAQYYRNTVNELKGSPVDQLVTQGLFDRSAGQGGQYRTPAEAVKLLREIGEDLKRDTRPTSYEPRFTAEDYLEAAKRIESGQGMPGKTYEVNLHARPESLLDLELPVVEQPAPVRAAVTDAIQQLRQEEKQRRGLNLSGGGRLFTPARGLNVPLEKMDGFEAQRALASGYGSEKAAELLQKRGIPGVRYLDEVSRTPPDQPYLIPPHKAAGGKWMLKTDGSPGKVFGSEAEAQAALQEAAVIKKPTNNYVMFPGSEHLIDIVKKYGLAAVAPFLGQALPVPQQQAPKL